MYRVQAAIDGRNTNIHVPLARRNPDNKEFPLRRLVFCRCITPLTGAWSKGKRAKYAYYMCNKRYGMPSIPVDTLNNARIHFLSTISPKKECLDVFIALLRRTYYKRGAQLQKRREQADTELKRLYTLWQTLIQKNLNGIYSDEIFKEQNKLIEEQIASVQISKDDTLLEKYNLEKIVKFMQDKFANLSVTYQLSTLSQIKVLLGSMFPTGLAWSYDGTLKYQISPLYQYIRTFNEDTIPSGAPGANYFEPLLLDYLAHFRKLMDAYESQEEEKE